MRDIIMLVTTDKVDEHQPQRVLGLATASSREGLALVAKQMGANAVVCVRVTMGFRDLVWYGTAVSV
jgi:uncharacterized protein YbjQ (UPF0145 family)